MGFIKCFFYLAAMGVIVFFTGRLLPKSWFQAERFPYRSYAFENGGKLYDRWFSIRAWQDRVPDMSKVFPGLMPAKKLHMRSHDRLPLMVQETCIAECTHALLSLLGLHCLRLWPGAGGVAVTLVYILLGNLPFILIQRYNRPRLMKLMKRCAVAGYGAEEAQRQAACAR